MPAPEHSKINKKLHKKAAYFLPWPQSGEVSGKQTITIMVSMGYTQTA